MLASNSEQLSATTALVTSAANIFGTSIEKVLYIKHDNYKLGPFKNMWKINRTYGSFGKAENKCSRVSFKSVPVLEDPKYLC